MFHKNDRWLKIAKIINDVSFVLTVVACVLAGIILAIVTEEALFILLIFAGPIAGIVPWFLHKFLFAYLNDIKYIRDKVYGVDNPASYNQDTFMNIKINSQQRQNYNNQPNYGGYNGNPNGNFNQANNQGYNRPYGAPNYNNQPNNYQPQAPVQPQAPAQPVAPVAPAQPAQPQATNPDVERVTNLYKSGILTEEEYKDMISKLNK